MKKFLIPIVAFVLLVLFLVSGYSRIEVVGHTKDAVQVTIVVTYWSLDRDAENRQKQAVWLALPDMFVQQIYADETKFRKAVAGHSPFWTITVRTIIPVDILRKLKAVSRSA